MESKGGDFTFKKPWRTWGKISLMLLALASIAWFIALNLNYRIVTYDRCPVFGDSYGCPVEQAANFVATFGPSDSALGFLAVAQESYLRQSIANITVSNPLRPIYVMALPSRDELVMWGNVIYDTPKPPFSALNDNAELSSGRLTIYSTNEDMLGSSVIRSCGDTKMSAEQVFNCPVVQVRIRQLVEDQMLERTLDGVGFVISDWKEIYFADVVKVPQP